MGVTDEPVVVGGVAHLAEGADVEVWVLSADDAPVQKPAVGRGDVEVDGFAGHTSHTQGAVTDVRSLGGTVRVIERGMGDVTGTSLKQTLLASDGDLWTVKSRTESDRACQGGRVSTKCGGRLHEFRR